MGFLNSRSPLEMELLKRAMVKDAVVDGTSFIFNSIAPHSVRQEGYISRGGSYLLSCSPCHSQQRPPGLCGSHAHDISAVWITPSLGQPGRALSVPLAQAPPHLRANLDVNRCHSSEAVQSQKQHFSVCQRLSGHEIVKQLNTNWTKSQASSVERKQEGECLGVGEEEMGRALVGWETREAVRPPLAARCAAGKW